MSLLQIIDPNDNSLYTCAKVIGSEGNCYPLNTYFGDSGVNVCELAGGAMMRPCCTSVNNWINVGCYSVDSILKAKASVRICRKG